ncbi:MAG: (d)CMP kinase [Bacteroidetes bacterium]|nr:(d)CMP kinase [Bacteroidota bacterium]
MHKRIRIAIDGPAASGKSTTARLLAEKLGYMHIDTGAMYRAITLKALEENIDLTNEDRLTDLARRCSVTFERDQSGNRIFLNGRDVTQEIRNPEVTKNVSLVSSHPKLREVMVELQRLLAAKGGVVVDGRDIGTVVIPDAEVKVFLVADVDERAKRRMADLQKTGITTSQQQVEQELVDRDYKDSTRSASPLRKADDAIEIDTTHLTIDEQVQKIFEYVQKKYCLNNEN